MAIEEICVSVDSRFRDVPETSTDSEFTMTFPNIYKNAAKVELVSAEIPVFSHSFSTDETTILQVREGPGTNGLWPGQTWSNVIIPTGNYTASGLASELQNKIGTALGFSQAASPSTDQGFVVSIDEITGKVNMGINFGSSEYGGIGEPDMSSFDINITPVELNSAYTYGVNSGDISVGTADTYLHEIGVYASAIRSWSEITRKGTPVLRDLLGFSDFLLYGLSGYISTDHFGLYGYPYLLLQVNDYETIDHVTGGNIVKCFAKLSLDERGDDNGRGNGGGYAFSFEKDAVAFPRVFDQPRNVNRFDVRLLTPMGVPVDLLGARLSFTVKITYIRDSRKYDERRDEYIPSGPITNYRSPGSRPYPDSKPRRYKTELRNVRFSVEGK
jgi:hypothetical protein